MWKKELRLGRTHDFPERLGKNILRGKQIWVQAQRGRLWRVPENMIVPVTVL